MKDIQGAYEEIGKYGCYFLSLLKTANKEQNALEYYFKYLGNKWIDKECFVMNPTNILNDLHGRKFNVIRSNSYDNKASVKIACWYNPRTNYRHFVLMRDNKEVLFDSFGQSITVKEGFIESWRLFYLV